MNYINHTHIIKNKLKLQYLTVHKIIYNI